MRAIDQGILLGAQRGTRLYVPVRPGNDFDRTRANNAALRAGDAARRLTGLDARQLADEQRRLRAEFYAKRRAT